MSGLITQAEHSIFVAADVEPEQLQDLVENIGEVEGLGGYKLGFEVGLGMSLRSSVDIVRNSSAHSLIVYDHQKAGTDIAGTGLNFGRTMQRGGVDAAILFPFTGPKVEEAYIKELQQRQIGVLVGSEMTQEQMMLSEGGYISDEAFVRMFMQAVGLGVRDFVVPGNKPEKVKEYKELFDREIGEGYYSLWAPGFITQGGDISKTGFVAGPSFHAFVGSAIYNAESPRQVTHDLGQKILALDS